MNGARLLKRGKNTMGMSRCLAGGLSAAFLLLALGPAHAEFSDEWNEMVEATKSECATFENSLTQPAGERPKIVPGTRKKITWPNGYSGRPYICLYFKFDLDAEGAPTGFVGAPLGREHEGGRGRIDPAQRGHVHRPW